MIPSAFVVILDDCGRDSCSEPGARLSLIASLHVHDVGMAHWA